MQIIYACIYVVISHFASPCNYLLHLEKATSMRKISGICRIFHQKLFACLLSQHAPSLCLFCFRWRGSIYKLIWIDLIGFLSMYYSLSLTYRYALDYNQKRQVIYWLPPIYVFFQIQEFVLVVSRTFEAAVKYCHEYSDLIPLSFVLGFYVSVVMTRWWSQYTTIPFPDSLAVFVSTTIHGQVIVILFFILSHSNPTDVDLAVRLD